MAVVEPKEPLSMCPFCGNRDVAVQGWLEPPKAPRYFVRCEPCDIVGPWAHSYDEAITKWNRRVLPLAEFDR